MLESDNYGRNRNSALRSSDHIQSITEGNGNENCNSHNEMRRRYQTTDNKLEKRAGGDYCLIKECSFLRAGANFIGYQTAPRSCDYLVLGARRRRRGSHQAGNNSRNSRRRRRSNNDQNIDLANPTITIEQAASVLNAEVDRTGSDTESSRLPSPASIRRILTENGLIGPDAMNNEINEMDEGEQSEFQPRSVSSSSSSENAITSSSDSESSTEDDDALNSHDSQDEENESVDEDGSDHYVRDRWDGDETDLDSDNDQAGASTGIRDSASRPAASASDMTSDPDRRPALRNSISVGRVVLQSVDN